MFIEIYIICVLISSVLWFISCIVTPQEERFATDNIILTAFINLSCLPIFLFLYFVLSHIFSTFKK